MGATTTLEINVEFEKDAQAQFERVQSMKKVKNDMIFVEIC